MGDRIAENEPTGTEVGDKFAVAAGYAGARGGRCMGGAGSSRDLVVGIAEVAAVLLVSRLDPKCIEMGEEQGECASAHIRGMG
jgi:hypothetical protein